jgi:hypothetical protein
MNRERGTVVLDMDDWIQLHGHAEVIRVALQLKGKANTVWARQEARRLHEFLMDLDQGLSEK